MKLKKYIISTLIAAVYILFIFTVYKQYAADVLSTKAENYLGNGNNAEALTAINKALKYNRQEPSYYKQRAKIYIVSTINFSEDSETYINLKNAALTDLLIAQELNPRNLATIRNTAPLYFFLANKDLSKQASQENYDPYYGEISKEYFLQMQRYLPTDVGVQVLAAKYQKRLDQETEYTNSINIIRDLRPDLLEWHPDL